MIAHGRPLVFGIQKPKPLMGFPSGKTRIRMRNTSYAKVCVRTSEGIRMFIPEERDNQWWPGIEVGHNTTEK
jgi:hypothetical protein